jgi:hypothetical protein
VSELGIRSVIDLRIESEVTLRPDADCAVQASRLMAAPLPVPYNVSVQDYVAVLNASDLTLRGHALPRRAQRLARAGDALICLHQGHDWVNAEAGAHRALNGSARALAQRARHSTLLGDRELAGEIPATQRWACVSCTRQLLAA